jgi:hypothetical protein
LSNSQPTIASPYEELKLQPIQPVAEGECDHDFVLVEAVIGKWYKSRCSKCKELDYCFG